MAVGVVAQVRYRVPRYSISLPVIERKWRVVWILG